MNNDKLRALLEKVKSQGTVQSQTSRGDTEDYEYNPKQQEAIDAILAGQSVLITGPAGSGKTTTVKLAIQAVLKAEKLSPLESEGNRAYQWPPGSAVDMLLRPDDILPDPLSPLS